MSDNICKFVKTKNVNENINIINFVYEKDANFKQHYIFPACHSVYFVVNGNGVLHTMKGDYPISNGNLFFTFSSKPFYIQNVKDLQYIYISFIGLRASGLYERLHISYSNPVYDKLSFLREKWIEDFEKSNIYNIDLICESLLLYTFSYLCESDEEKYKTNAYASGILNLKAYVDMHYAESDLNLKTVSERFHYSPKYVSNAFIKTVRVSFSDYLCDLRIGHAQHLLKSGIRNIQEVAYSSGFSDTQYFSKVFRKRLNLTPTQYYKNCKNKIDGQ